MATRDDEPEVHHSLRADEVNINVSNNILSGRARQSDNCLQIMRDKQSGHLDLVLIFFNGALDSIRCKRNCLFVIFTTFGAVRSKTGTAPSSPVPIEQIQIPN